MENEKEGTDLSRTREKKTACPANKTTDQLSTFALKLPTIHFPVQTYLNHWKPVDDEAHTL
jgi:hypothetical protein